VKIVFDKREKEIDGVVPGLEEFSGDSILFYNDSVFTERDYQSFQVNFQLLLLLSSSSSPSSSSSSSSS
jgi:hypothetical protein